MEGLSINARRQGIDKIRTMYIRQSVIQLQSLIPEFRIGHETVYYPCDLVIDGHASKGVKPPESLIRDMWICRVGGREADANPHSTTNPPVESRKCDRYPVKPMEWADRHDIIEGRVAVNGGSGVSCIDPGSYTFYVYPEIFDCYVLSVFWDGLKLDFKDNEETPFNEMMADAVALFVQGRLARVVDHDLSMFGSYMAEFQKAKNTLYIDCRQKAMARRAA